MSLASCQKAWAEALSAGQFDGADAWIDSDGLPSHRRLWIYHNQLRITWREALETTYPAIVSLTGSRYFRRIARDYGRWHKAPGGNLQDYGAALPAYLAQRPEISLYPYLPDVARLEWARSESVTAAEEPGIRLDALAAFDASAWPDLRLRLAASLRLVASPYPVARIWAAASGDAQHKEAARAGLQRREAAAIVLYRQRRAVVMETLPPSVWRWLLALTQDRRLADAVALACETAAALQSPFDLQDALAWAFARKLVTGIKSPAHEGLHPTHP
ncbi:MAG: DNA-binding domain-containing protein [Gammaproteobacteria bacterium]|nr:DNA-binding domain-containing protein [Gammaproteobacteria bacterium]